MINSRPIIPISDDKSDLIPLTPVHFLIIMRNPFLVPVPATYDEYENSNWQAITQMVQNFCHRWSAEYLTSLQPCKKWLSEQDYLHNDDVVYIINEITPPEKWPLGQVTALHPGKDGNFLRVSKTNSSRFTNV